MTLKECANLTLASMCAGLAGAGLALLLAPQSGKRTRRDLLKMGGSFKDRLEDFREDFQDRLSDLVSDIEQNASTGLASGRRMSAQIGEDLVKPLHSTREMLSRQIEKAESLLGRSNVH